MVSIPKRAKKTQIENEWISEKDIIGGPIFFRGMHTIPTHYITQRYEDDFQDFKRLCRQLNGQSVDVGDLAMNGMPHIPDSGIMA